MNLPDINIWLALTISHHAHHKEALRWLQTQETRDSIVFCRTTQQGYLRLLSHQNMMAAYRMRALTNAQAWETYESFLADDRINFLNEPAELTSVWRQLGALDTASTKRWMDAYLAAFAITGTLKLVTFDRAFSSYAPHGLDLELIETP
jgi:toxin-antitoxin system PIN domain toxin